MIRSRFVVGSIAVILAAGLACRGSGDDAPPCSAVAARFLDLAKYDLAQAKVDETTAREVTDQLPAMRDALAQACNDGKWSPAIRRCLVHAGDHVSFEGCEQQLTDEQRRDLDRANRAPGSATQ